MVQLKFFVCVWGTIQNWLWLSGEGKKYERYDSVVNALGTALTLIICKWPLHCECTHEICGRLVENFADS